MDVTTELREAILTTVNSHQGVKGVELVVNVMGIINPLLFNHHEYAKTIQSLVDSGEIIELEYTVPQVDYRIKSLYFPRGTEFQWHQNLP